MKYEGCQGWSAKGGVVWVGGWVGEATEGGRGRRGWTGEWVVG